MPRRRPDDTPTRASTVDEAHDTPDAGGSPLHIAEPPGDQWEGPRAVPYTPPEAMREPELNEDDPDLPFWLALNRVKGIGPARFTLLLDAFGTAQTAWQAESTDWQAAGLDGRTAAAFERQRKTIVPEAEWERLRRLRVTALRVTDDEYPPLLREVSLPPPILYVRGALAPEDAVALALVGTRRATTYGRQVTERLAAELVEQGLTIVSGLARVL